MTGNRLVFGLAFLFVLAGCGEKGLDGSLAPIQSAIEDTEEILPAVTSLEYAERVESDRAKIFLVAGSQENANFLQEIAEQRDQFLKLGFKEDEIKCYYSKPGKKYFKEDQKQFESLYEKAQHCEQANVQNILTDIRRSAHGNHEFMYFYITSHGSSPFSVIGEDKSIHPYYQTQYKNLAAEYPGLGDQYFLVVDGAPDGKTAKVGRLLEHYIDNQGIDTDDLFLTPRSLHNSITHWPYSTPKYVVLQGCHSGGFFEDPRPGHFDRFLLNSVENLVGYAAARYDRSSFGCNSDGHRTYFGGVFNDAFAEQNKSPVDIRWGEMFEKINIKVEKWKKKLRKNTK